MIRSLKAGTDCTKEFEVFEHSEKARVSRYGLAKCLGQNGWFEARIF